MDIYNNEEYWRAKGETYVNWFSYQDQNVYHEQEQRLLEVLDKIEFHTVLEVGCGFGRITKLVYDRYKPSLYDALDLSQHQIDNARNTLEGRNVNLSVTPFGEYKQTKKYDLVVACEVLMHIPFSDIDTTVAKMVLASRKYVLNLDWNAGETKEIYHCFSHNYKEIYGSFGCTSETTPIKNQDIVLAIVPN